MTPKFCVLFVYSLHFFISTHYYTKQKQYFYLLVSFFSITKQTHKRSKIDKSIFYLPILIIQKTAFICQQTLTNTSQYSPPIERILSIKNNKEIIFLYICTIIMPSIETKKAQK